GTQSRTHEPTRSPRGRDQFAGRLQTMTVSNSGRTDGLAGAATETAPEMQIQDAVIGREIAALERAHQLDTAARAVGLVAGGEVRGARLQAEAAVHARLQSREPVNR